MAGTPVTWEAEGKEGSGTDHVNSRYDGDYEVRSFQAWIQKSLFQSAMGWYHAWMTSVSCGMRTGDRDWCIAAAEVRAYVNFFQSNEELLRRVQGNSFENGIARIGSQLLKSSALENRTEDD